MRAIGLREREYKVASMFPMHFPVAIRELERLHVMPNIDSAVLLESYGDKARDQEMTLIGHREWTKTLRSQPFTGQRQGLVGTSSLAAFYVLRSGVDASAGTVGGAVT